MQEQSDLGLHCLHMPFCHNLWCTKFWNIYLKVIFKKAQVPTFKERERALIKDYPVLKTHMQCHKMNKIQ